MPSYAHTQQVQTQQKSADGGAVGHQPSTHVTVRDDAMTIHGSLAERLNLNPRALGLLEMRQAFNESSSVQSQLALQRALNPSSAQAVQVGASQGPKRKKPQPMQRKRNATGLPDGLKDGVEQLSGLALDDVRVHYNSPKPAAVQAHAYLQGTDIHLAPGQEKHLPHEAWHAVQQKQGRVKPTLQLKGVAINDDSWLEREADGMGRKASAASALLQRRFTRLKASGETWPAVIQRVKVRKTNGEERDIDNLSISELKELAKEVSNSGDSQAIDDRIKLLEGSEKKDDNKDTDIQSLAPKTTPSNSSTAQAGGGQNSKPLTKWQKIAKAKKLKKFQKKHQKLQTKEEKSEEEQSVREQQDFSSADEMIRYLAGELDYSAEEMKKYANENVTLFADFANMSKEDIDEDLDEWGKIIIGLMHQSKHTSAPGVSGGGGDWATKRVRKAAAEMATGDENLFPGGKYTVHHKVSRHQLKSLFKLMSEDEKSGPVGSVLDSMSESVGAKSHLKILLNMPGNLEVGPLDDYRAEHLGANFDPNPGTPRSEKLGTVDDMITSGKVDWDALAGKLKEVKELHEKKLLEEKLAGPLTQPLKEQWKKGKGGKFQRGSSDTD